MNKKWILYIAGLILCFTPELFAQTYEVIERRNFWNVGKNVTGIRMDSLTVSYAELYGKNGSGDFRDYYQADQFWNAGAVAQTITHTGKYSMKGSFSFNHMAGKNMSGSMFIKPGFYPVDILEFTPGRKELQTYAFSGGISVDITPAWRIGGNINFISANYAKRKDLRHSNYRLDMAVTPGIMYHTGDYAIGLAYTIGKNGETIEAEEIGTASTPYDAFLDKGLMNGAYEAWTGSGIHLKENGITGFPVKEISHGVSLQAQINTLYMDIEYMHSSGTIGEKDLILFTFPAHRISSHLGYRFIKGKNLHFLRFNLDWYYQENNENILTKETNNGITLVQIYGSNRIFERNRLYLNPEYEYTSSKMELTAGAGISFLKRQSTQMYPYVFSQTMRNQQLYISGVWHTGNFDWKAKVEFSTGTFTDTNRTVNPETDAGDDLYHLKNYYNLQNEYMSATRIDTHLGCRWNFTRKLYAEIEAEYIHGFNLHYIGGTERWVETVKIGYKF
ncbi:MAG: hypothetical protein LIP01_03400 [Tannerellaceae bacterium]|nr:hypothetical protein [Tannerellaceae bacterium]